MDFFTMLDLNASTIAVAVGIISLAVSVISLFLHWYFRRENLKEIRTTREESVRPRLAYSGEASITETKIKNVGKGELNNLSINLDTAGLGKTILEANGDETVLIIKNSEHNFNKLKEMGNQIIFTYEDRNGKIFKTYVDIEIKERQMGAVILGGDYSSSPPVRYIVLSQDFKQSL